MASSWGSSWLDAFGNSWGEVTVDPNAMVGSGTFGLSATGILTAELVQHLDVAGAGHPVGIWWGERKIKKGKKLDAILKKAMRQIIEGDAEPELIAAKAVEIVKPFVEKKAKQKCEEAPKYKIDWAALEKDAKKVQELLSLWQQQLELLEDEEMLLMMVD